MFELCWRERADNQPDGYLFKSRTIIHRIGENWRRTGAELAFWLAVSKEMKRNYSDGWELKDAGELDSNSQLIDVDRAAYPIGDPAPFWCGCHLTVWWPITGCWFHFIINYNGADWLAKYRYWSMLIDGDLWASIHEFPANCRHFWLRFSESTGNGGWMLPAFFPSTYSSWWFY